LVLALGGAAYAGFRKKDEPSVVAETPAEKEKPLTKKK